MDRARALPMWWDTLDTAAESDGPLPGSIDADVVIVGAGYTGLWTAYHLSVAAPDLRIVVLESEHVGFGASGRNGGWCSAEMPMSLHALSKRHGRDAAVRLQHAMNSTVSEIGEIADTEGIDCGFAHGGSITLARTRPQVRRLHSHLDESREFGFGEDHHRWMSASEARSMVAATDVLGGVFTPDCAALHPARLAAGLCRAVRRRGVVVHDHTRAVELSSGRVRTDRGTVRAPLVVRATEGYTSQLAGHRRETIPVYSLMIATAPLDESTWSAIGLEQRPTFNDARQLVIYGQRTSDGRLAFGGRGAPYHFGSRISPENDLNVDVHRNLVSTLMELFPVLEGVEITHRWGGPLGVPRDWHASVRFDRESGLASAGGYVGDGVSTAFLAARTLADLILDRDSDLVSLPWVQHRSPRWEVEPIRWTAVNAALVLPRSIDASEARTGRTARLRSRLLGLLTGG